MANQAFLNLIRRKQKKQHLSDNASLYGYYDRPIPANNSVQWEAFYSPFARVTMLAGAGFSALASMRTTANAYYVPQQTKVLQDGFGSGIGPHDMGELQNLSPQSQQVGIYTPATAAYANYAASQQNSGPS